MNHQKSCSTKSGIEIGFLKTGFPMMVQMNFKITVIRSDAIDRLNKQSDYLNPKRISSGCVSNLKLELKLLAHVGSIPGIFHMLKLGDFQQNLFEFSQYQFSKSLKDNQFFIDFATISWESKIRNSFFQSCVS